MERPGNAILPQNDKPRSYWLAALLLATVTFLMVPFACQSPEPGEQRWAGTVSTCDCDCGQNVCESGTAICGGCNITCDNPSPVTIKDPPTCGDGECDEGENGCNCPLDCDYNLCRLSAGHITQWTTCDGSSWIEVSSCSSGGYTCTASDAVCSASNQGYLQVTQYGLVTECDPLVGCDSYLINNDQDDPDYVPDPPEIPPSDGQ